MHACSVTSQQFCPASSLTIGCFTSQSPHLHPASSSASQILIQPLLFLSLFYESHRSWAKSTIFINKPVSALLKDAGNIPVDRKNKDNQALFSGTFEVLKLNEAVAIFPEGTSYTEPGMQAIKEGASWVSATLRISGESDAIVRGASDIYRADLVIAFLRLHFGQAALEYAKNIRTQGSQNGKPAARDVNVVVASIVYTQKTNYRSRAVMQYVASLSTMSLLCTESRQKVRKADTNARIYR